MIRSRLTVLFSVFNGESVVGRVLDGYLHQQGGFADWRLVAVDNGSLDRTREILASFSQKLPLTIVSQPAPGKNRALNTALASIETDLLVLTDDDAIPHPTLLRDWSDLIGAHETYSVFGARIRPIFDLAPPKWLTASSLPFDVLYAARDLASGPVAAQEIFGPNMALRGSLIRSGLRFNESIGPNGADKNYPMGSETEMCERLARAGEKCFFFSPPQVDHIVRRTQVTLAYIEGRARRSGRGEARRRLLAGTITPDFASTGLRRMSREMGRAVRAVGSRLPPSRVSLRLLWDKAWSQGFYEELASTAAGKLA